MFVGMRKTADGRAKADAVGNMFASQTICQVEQGSYLERALLFKVLADHIGLQSSLVRGEYGRAYNVISSPTQGENHWDLF